MEYIKVTGIDYGESTVHQEHPVVSSKYGNKYSSCLADCMNTEFCGHHLSWSDYSSELTEEEFVKLIESGGTEFKITGWLGDFDVILFSDELEEEFYNIFRNHPQPWTYKSDFTRYDSLQGSNCPGIMDANGECIVSGYQGTDLVDMIWAFYNYYTRKVAEL